MIKIRDFAKICNTTTQTLRYYDAEGLLKADYVDSSSGYRYYTPEAVERYKKIMFYKSLGFSLEDIKRLLTLSGKEMQNSLIQKKKEMVALIKNIQRQISVIEDLCKTDSISARFTRDIFRIPFENDPEVIGKWRLCGQIKDTENPDFSDFSEAPATIRKEIIFLPGGAFYWMFFWTKGTLYRISGKYNFAIPNSYRITEYRDTKYMILQYMSDDCIENGKDVIVLLYSQADKRAYTKEQIRLTDRTDIPFIEDPEVIGDWTVCDFVSEIADFKAGAVYTENCGASLSGVSFLPRGIFLRKHKNGTTQFLRYTKGVVLNHNMKTAEKYLIKKMCENEYLFIQHKSGDYSYGWKKPHWFVFKREKP